MQLSCYHVVHPTRHSTRHKAKYLLSMGGYRSSVWTSRTVDLREGVKKKRSPLILLERLLWKLKINLQIVSWIKERKRNKATRRPTWIPGWWLDWLDRPPKLRYTLSTPSKRENHLTRVLSQSSSRLQPSRDRQSKSPFPNIHITRSLPFVPSSPHVWEKRPSYLRIYIPSGQGHIQAENETAHRQI